MDGDLSSVACFENLVSDCLKIISSLEPRHRPRTAAKLESFLRRRKVCRKVFVGVGSLAAALAIRLEHEPRLCEALKEFAIIGSPTYRGLVALEWAANDCRWNLEQWREFVTWQAGLVQPKQRSAAAADAHSEFLAKMLAEYPCEEALLSSVVESLLSALEKMHFDQAVGWTPDAVRMAIANASAAVRGGVDAPNAVGLLRSLLPFVYIPRLNRNDCDSYHCKPFLLNSSEGVDIKHATVSSCQGPEIFQGHRLRFERIPPAALQVSSPHYNVECAGSYKLVARDSDFEIYGDYSSSLLLKEPRWVNVIDTDTQYTLGLDSSGHWLLVCEGMREGPMIRTSAPCARSGRSVADWPCDVRHPIDRMINCIESDTGTVSCFSLDGTCIGEFPVPQGAAVLDQWLVDALEAKLGKAPNQRLRLVGSAENVFTAHYEGCRWMYWSRSSNAWRFDDDIHVSVTPESHSAAPPFGAVSEAELAAARERIAEAVLRLFRDYFPVCRELGREPPSDEQALESAVDRALARLEKLGVARFMQLSAKKRFLWLHQVAFIGRTPSSRHLLELLCREGVLECLPVDPERLIYNEEILQRMLAGKHPEQQWQGNFPRLGCLRFDISISGGQHGHGNKGIFEELGGTEGIKAAFREALKMEFGKLGCQGRPLSITVKAEFYDAASSNSNGNLNKGVKPRKKPSNSNKMTWHARVQILGLLPCWEDRFVKSCQETFQVKVQASQKITNVQICRKPVNAELVELERRLRCNILCNPDGLSMALSARKNGFDWLNAVAVVKTILGNRHCISIMGADFDKETRQRCRTIGLSFVHAMAYGTNIDWTHPSRCQSGALLTGRPTAWFFVNTDLHKESLDSSIDLHKESLDSYCVGQECRQRLKDAKAELLNKLKANFKKTRIAAKKARIAVDGDFDDVDFPSMAELQMTCIDPSDADVYTSSSKRSPENSGRCRPQAQNTGTARDRKKWERQQRERKQGDRLKARKETRTRTAQRDIKFDSK